MLVMRIALDTWGFARTSEGTGSSGTFAPINQITRCHIPEDFTLHSRSRDKTDVSGLQIFLHDKFVIWASNGSNVEEIRTNLKNIVYENIERFVPHKTFRKNSDHEYYNKEIKQLKSKVRKEYHRRKLGVHCTEKLKPLSKQLLAAKKSAKEAFLKSILSKEGKCWSDFYKYVKRRNGN